MNAFHCSMNAVTTSTHAPGPAGHRRRTGDTPSALQEKGRQDARRRHARADPARLNAGENGPGGLRVLQAMAFSAVLMLAGCADKPSEATGPAADMPAAGEDVAQATAGGGHEDHDDQLRLSDEARAAAGLVIAPAGPGVLQERISLYGVVRPDAERVRDVAARFPGVVRSVRVRVGDEVRQGAALASVESNESLQTYAIHSPLSGVVTERLTNPGEQTQSQPLFTVVDLSSVWVELALYPRERAQVQAGQRVRVTTTDGGVSGEGRIIFVSPLGAAQTQSLTARVALDNADRRWSPGLYVAGEVIVGDQQAALTVPAAALQDVEGRTSVFVEQDGAFHARAVQVGRQDDELVEILAGLAPGDRVVGEGSFVLKAELGKSEASHDH